MFFKTKEEIPEAIADQFVESELNGVKGWQDKDSFELKQHLFNIKDENKKLKETNTDYQTKMSDYETQQAEAVRKAREEALVEARKNNNTEEAQKIIDQQIADARTRAEQEGYEKARKELMDKQAAKDASNIANEVGLSLGIDDDDGYAIADLIRGRIKIDPDTGKEIYYDNKGGALSVDRDGFVAEIKKEPRFKRLIKGVVPTNGGGNANGSGHGGAVNKKFNELTGAELSELRKKDPAAYERLKSEFYA